MVQVYEGQDVLPMVLQEEPVAVMMQADLPGKLKGREVLRQLKADPQYQQVPVLVFSWQGHGIDGSAPDDWLGEAAAYLQEPVTFESFQDALQKAGIAHPAAATVPFSSRQAAVQRPAGDPPDGGPAG